MENSEEEENDDKSESVEIFQNIILFFIFFLFISSIICFLFRFVFVAIHPKYKNQIEKSSLLRKSISNWNTRELSKQFYGKKVIIEVPGFNQKYLPKHILKDPKFKVINKFPLNYQYQPSLFYYKSANIEFSYLFGTFYFGEGLVPLGKSDFYCFQVSIHYMKLNITKTLENTPSCRDSKLEKDILAFSISPWIEIKENLGLASSLKSFEEMKINCNKLMGIVKKFLNEVWCYRYKVLNQLCIIVNDINNDEFEFAEGFTANEKIEEYVDASPNVLYDFKKFNIFIRHKEDPYLLARELGKSSYKPYSNVNIEMPEFIFYLDKLGMILFLISFLFLSLMKLEKIKRL